MHAHVRAGHQTRRRQHSTNPRHQPRKRPFFHPRNSRTPRERKRITPQTKAPRRWQHTTDRALAPENGRQPQLDDYHSSTGRSYHRTSAGFTITGVVVFSTIRANSSQVRCSPSLVTHTSGSPILKNRLAPIPRTYRPPACGYRKSRGRRLHCAR